MLLFDELFEMVYSLILKRGIWNVDPVAYSHLVLVSSSLFKHVWNDLVSFLFLLFFFSFP